MSLLFCSEKSRTGLDLWVQKTHRLGRLGHFLDKLTRLSLLNYKHKECCCCSRRGWFLEVTLLNLNILEFGEIIIRHKRGWTLADTILILRFPKCDSSTKIILSNLFEHGRFARNAKVNIKQQWKSSTYSVFTIIWMGFFAMARPFHLEPLD